MIPSSGMADLEQMARLPQLNVPAELAPNSIQRLPELTADTLSFLGEAGWSRVGLMVAFIDSSGNIMMLEHNARDKNQQGVLGPLGETSQEGEQPLETLARGIHEELDENPQHLDLWIPRRSGWVINQWPRGDAFPGQFACAISFPVFVSEAAKYQLLARRHETEEISRLHFLSVDGILAMESAKLRPGVKDWLRQLGQAGLLEPRQLERLQLPAPIAATVGNIVLSA